MTNEIPELFSQTGKSKSHNLKSQFHKNYKASNQNEQLVPINLQNKVKVDRPKKLQS